MKWRWGSEAQAVHTESTVVIDARGGITRVGRFGLDGLSIKEIHLVLGDWLRLIVEKIQWPLMFGKLRSS